MKVHFIAIGGAVMHNLAIALHKKGYVVTGSDDEIFEPSRSRLDRYGLLPDHTGWNADRIIPGLDAVILGMHAREGNPELKKALELGIPVSSFPEYLFGQTKNKKRIVIGGSHGKTTITSMVMHVLKTHHVSLDYMVGSQIEGFETMVGLSDDSGIAVFEGDEYLSSALDRRPKFHLYKPNLALISGIAWDHMNVFPEYETYLEQFRIFIEKIEAGGTLIYCREDPEVASLVKSSRRDLDFIPYGEHPCEIRKERTYLLAGEGDYLVPVFGKHNMQNINGARIVCNKLDINDEMFYKAIQSFPGAKKRMQLLSKNQSTSVYLDFAHAPSKVRATSQAMKEQFPERKLVAVLELHTYSSLNERFIPQYRDSLNAADAAVVYFSNKTLEHKKLPPLTTDQVRTAFGRSDLQVYNEAGMLLRTLRMMDWNNCNLLIMTSGNFNGQDLEGFARGITERS
jgi:UDP-N-acetylmuramate: L-alanyl-gamma-D-glutamyl-meso-diaminopimelate ligase